ncbi:hypothetical protein BI334_30010 [Moorena producens 3L]|uniref:Uncharacterized protein n=1 Tax=Moorena producens (strain JHB) TaxID=1454205 RepID=A0A1D9G8W6_MOOP1|nr:hypothetical protein BI334_30010 [Moorena producens 3L]
MISAHLHLINFEKSKMVEFVLFNYPFLIYFLIFRFYLYFSGAIIPNSSYFIFLKQTTLDETSSLWLAKGFLWFRTS